MTPARYQAAGRCVCAAGAGRPARYSLPGLDPHRRSVRPQAHQPEAGCHSFDRVWNEPGLDDRFPKPAPTWTNGQLARRNRTLQEAPVRRYHDDTPPQLPQHLPAGRPCVA